MNYNDPELQSRLAAEYVLGTLRGRARRRFERLIRSDASIEKAVLSWEKHLSDLNDLPERVTPPANSWNKIEQRLFGSEQSGSAGVADFWRWLGISASALSVLLIYNTFNPLLLSKPGPTDVSSANYVSIIEGESNKPVWLVQMDQAAQTLKVRALGVPAIENNQDYELWLLQPDDQPPVSLGLMPASSERALSLKDLPYESAQGIAVSIEPKGGSTTGQPTGPVVYVASLIRTG